jgi:2-oxoglutarate dehydrogenase complex dehydrogenase (E1) component-like enzyme
LSEEVICALLRDFRKHGEKAVAQVRRTQPAAYLKICALLVPREMKVEHSSGVASLSDEELEQAIAAIRAMLAAQAENAKVIEGTVEPAALPAPTELEQPRRKRSNRLLEHVDTAVGPSERGKRKP